MNKLFKISKKEIELFVSILWFLFVTFQCAPSTHYIPINSSKLMIFCDTFQIQKLSSFNSDLKPLTITSHFALHISTLLSCPEICYLSIPIIFKQDDAMWYFPYTSMPNNMWKPMTMTHFLVVIHKLRNTRGGRVVL